MYRQQLRVQQRTKWSWGRKKSASAIFQSTQFALELSQNQLFHPYFVERENISNKVFMWQIKLWCSDATSFTLLNDSHFFYIEFSDERAWRNLIQFEEFYFQILWRSQNLNRKVLSFLNFFIFFISMMYFLNISH